MNEELLKNIEYLTKEIELLKSELSSISKHVTPISLPSENIKELKNISEGTYNYEMHNGVLVEKMYVNGEFVPVSGKVHTLSNINVSVNMGEPNSEINTPIVLGKDGYLVLTDIASESKCKIYVDSGRLIIEEVE